MGDCANAQKVFEEMLQQAQIGGWQRSVVHAQNWLAYTAILQGHLDRGAQYLHMGWPVANRIKEKRLNAYYRRSFAYYHRALGCRAEALEWAETALDSFERLGMLPETHEMEALAESLRAD
jgi:hypothetical protein